ncbi:MAG: hypothetical protein GC159_15150 [Phycisphaera sp.]|nr:hypothetical protein [Phycisphaera sp.]
MADETNKNDTADNTPAQLQGWVPDVEDHCELFKALDKAFDYRGDVTLELRDGRTIEGYVFDRRTGQGLDDSVIRLIPRDSDDRLEVVYADIARLEFSGKDTAAGKSWENWVRRYVEKKMAGEEASIYHDEAH